MAQPKIILSAESCCDIGRELAEKCNVKLIGFPVTLDEKTYTDGIDITPDYMYNVFREKHILPKTSAINAAEYGEYFKQFTDEGCEVIHITLSSGMTSGIQSCILAASELPGIYVVDSKNISSAIGLLVLKARDLIDSGMSAKDIAAALEEMRDKSHCSFVLETLEYMSAGGRCSEVAAFAASVLSLKPCIDVNPENGKMYVSKKYRGNMEKVILQYVKDRLSKYDNIDKSRIFITHSGVPKEREDLVKNYLLNNTDFKEVFITRASCTISTHCGPGTLGILFMTK